MLLAQAVTWIKVDKPSFDLAGVVLGAFRLAGVMLVAALVLGLLIGAGLILSRRRSGRPSVDGVSLHLTGRGGEPPASALR